MGQWIFEKLAKAPSPDASSLGSYINFPVTNNAGLIPIDIPLGELNTDLVKIPVNLTYHSSGVRVEDEASSVGTNWTFNVSGVITRSVRGSADDINPNIIIDAGYHHITYWGWLDYGRKIPKGFPDSQWASSYGNTEERKEGYAIAYMDPATSIDVPDTEPDIYYVNAGSVQGKFLFDNDGTIRFLTANDFKITYERAGTPPYNNYCGSGECGINKFTVTDDLGNQYVFDQIETTTSETTEETMYNFKESSLSTVNSVFTSAWYLSRIISPNGKEINYTYKNVTTIQSPSLMQVRSACVEGDCTPHSGNTKSSKITIAGKIINSAWDQFLKLEFSSSSREDLNGGVKIDNINIKSTVTNDILKQYELSYFYSFPSIGLTGDAYKDKRLFLQQVDQVDKAGNRISHKLSYDRPNLLPPKNSAEQDFWGYYNANHAHDLIPSIYVYPAFGSADRYQLFPLLTYTGSQITLSGWDRSVEPAYITCGTISEIEFPTGGKVIYRFESNDFYGEGIGMQKGGGVRIAEVQYMDYNDFVVAKKQYDYTLDGSKSSGVLINMPKFAREMTYGPSPFKSQNGQPAVLAPNPNCTAYIYHRRQWDNPEYFNAETDLNEYDLWNIFTQRFTISRTPLSDLDGQQVSYTRVSIIEPDNGKTVNEYFSPRSYKTHASLVKTAGSVNTGTFVVPTTGGDVFPFTPACTDNGLVFGKIDKSGYNIFPYPPMSMDEVFTYGKIKSSTIYDVSGNIKQQHVYEYESHGSPIQISGLIFGAQEALCEEYESIRVPIIPRAWSIYSYYADADALLKREVVSEFETNSELITSEEYTYTDAYVKPKSIIKDASDGAKKITEFTYPANYGIQSDWSNTDNSLNNEIIVLREMANRNVFVPIETINSLMRDGQSKIVSASASKYVLVNNKLLPSQKKVLENQQPLTDFQGSYIDNTPDNSIVHFDNRYSLDHQVDKYNDNYYPLQESDRSQTYSYVYGYKNTYLVAFVTNATINQVYYTSFEDLTQGFSGEGRTGKKSKLNGFSKTLTQLIPGNYKLTFWKRNGIVWEFVSQDVLVTSDTYTINLNFPVIDELRFYPAEAQMTTYTYEPGIGITSISDQNSNTIYYEYDSFNRLSLVRDQDQKILKQYQYNYKN